MWTARLSTQVPTRCHRHQHPSHVIYPLSDGTAGGEHFYPNTIYDHADWAFNEYYSAHVDDQGALACDFGGVAELVVRPPPSPKRNSFLKYVLALNWPTVGLICQKIEISH